MDFGFAAALAVGLGGCAGAERWAATHEREYRAEYREGGGAVSMIVRPYGEKAETLKAEKLRWEVERMFRELEARRLPGSYKEVLK